MSKAALRLVVAAVCLIGIVLAGAFAPTVGISTPIPDLGIENGDDALGEELLSGGGQPVDGHDGSSSDASEDLLDAAGEFVDDPEMDEGGAPALSGTENYGGVSGGGYPDDSPVGGPLALSDHEEFYVESDEPSRWRLGAYATYTGDGWSREDGEKDSLDEPLSTVDGTTGPTSEIRVTPQREFESLATAWRPADGSAPGRDILVTEERGLKVSEPVTAGETYVTTTYGPPSHETAAAVSGTGSVPSDIQERYTQLPADTPPRLTDHTDEITSEAQTPYETAEAVQQWLTENKAYSLDVEHDQNADVATEFVFEMEAGYCEYFATSMVAMLRTQDVPARYVTGYGPGEQIGENEYLVRGQHAHAWVEVYIADVGWVTFDPTPSGERADADRDDVSPADDAGPDSSDPDTETGAGETQSDDEGQDGGSADESAGDDADEDGQEGETGDPADGDDGEEGDDDQAGGEEGEDSEEDEQEGGGEGEDSEEDEQEGGGEGEDSEEGEEGDGDPLSIDLAEDPIPGQELTVTVTRDGEPVSSVEVFFNDASVGTTDASGNVTGEVPYTESLTISTQDEAERSNSVSDMASPLGAVTHPADDGAVVYHFASDLRHNDEHRSSLRNMDANVTVDVPVDIEITVDQTPIAGESIDLAAHIDDTPVSNATVQFDGTEVAQTTAAGEATAELPDDDTVEINVSRGEAVGTRNLSVHTFEIATRATTGIPLPLTTATATVTLDDEPISNATVMVGGEPATVTGSDGTAAVELPFSDSADVTATTDIDGATPTATTTISNLYRNLVLVAGVFVMGIAAVTTKARRSGVSARTISHTVIRIFRFALSKLVGAAGSIASLLTAMRLAILRSLQLVRQGASGIKRLIQGVIRGVHRAIHRSITLIQSLGRQLHPLAILAALRNAVTRLRDSTTRQQSSGIQQTDETADEDVLTLREAWIEFRRYVSIRSWRTSTPGEIARWAIQKDGLPSEPVKTIADGFRDVEYGSRAASERVPAVRDAVTRLREDQQSEDKPESDESQ